MDEKFFTDYSEYIVGIPSLLISILVAVWVYIKQINKKKISISLYSRDIISIYHDEIKSDLIITYKDKIITELFLTSIKFTNEGNVPIKKEDFESNISIEINETNKAEILFSKIQFKIPKDLNVQLLKEDNKKVEIAAMLINSKEFFELSLLTDIKPEFNILARIAGVERLFKREQYLYVVTSLKESTFILVTLFTNLLVWALSLNILIPFSIPMTIFSIFILVRETINELKK